MTPKELLGLIGSDARNQLCGIATEMLAGAEATTIEPTALRYLFLRSSSQLKDLTWYDLLAAAMEVVSEGRMTIRRADQRLFHTEILGTARYLAVLPAEGAPDQVSATDSYQSLYYSGSELKFRREAN